MLQRGQTVGVINGKQVNWGEILAEEKIGKTLLVASLVSGLLEDYFGLVSCRKS